MKHLQFVNNFVRVSKTGADVLGHLIYLEKMEGLPKIRFTS
jgi:hypothetical protein